MPRRLTKRQRQILTLVANGNTNAAIARILGITAHSVAEILTTAYRRLGASDRAHAVAIALRLAEIDMADIHITHADDKDTAA